MTREILIAGRPAKLTIEAPNLRYQREEEAEPLTAHFSITPTSPGTYSVLLNGRSYRVTQGPGHLIVNGHRIEASAFDPRDRRTRNANATAQGAQQVTAPMPGKIVRVLVSVGDEVAEGQGLVVVEAMKMQNEMKSPKAGRVAEVRTKPDATVTAGDVLVVVE